MTLVWNQVHDTYDIRSTGQLIPFVIGLFGLLQLLHTMSVQSSHVQSNSTINAIMISSNAQEHSLIRSSYILTEVRTQESFDHDKKGILKSKPHWENNRKTSPSNGSSETFFKNNEIPHRHSVNEYRRGNSGHCKDLEKGRHSLDCLRSLKPYEGEHGPHI